MKYTKISDGIEAKVQNAQLYVRHTNMIHGVLEQEGRINRVIAAPYTGTLNAAQVENEYGVSDIDRTIERYNNDDDTIRTVQYGKKIN